MTEWQTDRTKLILGEVGQKCSTFLQNPLGSSGEAGRKWQEEEVHNMDRGT